jgi:hypothetical protein
MKKKLLTNKAGEARELTTKDIKKMKPAPDVLPKALLNTLEKRKRGERGLH